MTMAKRKIRAEPEVFQTPFFHFYIKKIQKYMSNRKIFKNGCLGVDLGMGCPTRRTRPNPPENSPTRPDPKSLMGGLGSKFLTRYD